MLKAYLDERYRGQELQSYMRVGKQIAEFVNRYVVEKVEVKKPLGFRKITDNVQMPERLL